MHLIQDANTILVAQLFIPGGWCSMPSAASVLTADRVYTDLTGPKNQALENHCC